MSFQTRPYEAQAVHRRSALSMTLMSQQIDSSSLPIAAGHTRCDGNLLPALRVMIASAVFTLS